MRRWWRQLQGGERCPSPVQCLNFFSERCSDWSCTRSLIRGHTPFFKVVQSLLLLLLLLLAAACCFPYCGMRRKELDKHPHRPWKVWTMADGMMWQQ